MKYGKDFSKATKINNKIKLQKRRNFNNNAYIRQ